MSRKKRTKSDIDREDRIQFLVNDIQTTWNKDNISELYDYFKPLFLKQKGAIIQHYHIGADEAEEELYSMFLQLLFFYKKNYNNRKTNKPGFEYVKFTYWLKRHIKRTWYFLDRETKKRIDPRGRYITQDVSQSETLINEMKDYAKANLSENEYSIFVKHFVDGYTKNEVAYESGIETSALNYIIRHIKKVLKEYLSDKYE